MWTASSATGDGDGMTCFPINSESRSPFYLSICLIQVPQISQYLNESRLAYTILSVSLAKVPCKVSGWLCKLPGDYVPADKWGLFSLFYLWWHMELDWNRIESLCLVLQKFIPIRIGNLWKLFCGQLQPLKTLVIWWWECFVSVTCQSNRRRTKCDKLFRHCRN